MEAGRKGWAATQVSPKDAQTQFLIPLGSVGKNRAEASLERARDLNPMVDVKADQENVDQKTEEFFTHFDVVCLTCCSQEVLMKVDQICHKNGIKFFAGDVFGYHGYMFANLGEHEFVEEKIKLAKASQIMEDGPDSKKAKLDFTETTMVKKHVVFCPLKEAFGISWSSQRGKATLKRTTPDYFLLRVLLKFRTEKGRDPSPQACAEDAEVLLQTRTGVLESLGAAGADLLPDDFARCCFSEMASVCAVVGGVLGQEIVKALSQRDAPLNNFFFFDGMKGNGIVECLAPG
ncbi:SUMO-activating enzyme subunit 1 isoform X2 [Eublepharis macularius]|uniref:SUMO-activating enzyme subunit 1 isoform X2 n=1 Tax=Eublepharis macularius TaxID=481883 RepID=A0AA97KFB6_EUBMA|nr:SUMO-activating enzyme subunit 1 isoform X2 [Eublepharis macularius]